MKTTIKSASTVVDGLDRPFMMDFYPENGGHNAFASKSRVFIAKTMPSKGLFLRPAGITVRQGTVGPMTTLVEFSTSPLVSKCFESVPHKKARLSVCLAIVPGSNPTHQQIGIYLTGQANKGWIHDRIGPVRTFAFQPGALDLLLGKAPNELEVSDLRIVSRKGSTYDSLWGIREQKLGTIMPPLKVTKTWEHVRSPSRSRKKSLQLVVFRRGGSKAIGSATCQASCLELMIKELYSSAGGISALEAKADVYAEAIQARDRFVRAERSRICAETFLVCVTSGTITLVSVMA